MSIYQEYTRGRYEAQPAILSPEDIHGMGCIDPTVPHYNTWAANQVPNGPAYMLTGVSEPGSLNVTLWKLNTGNTLPAALESGQDPGDRGVHFYRMTPNGHYGFASVRSTDKLPVHPLTVDGRPADGAPIVHGPDTGENIQTLYGNEVRIQFSTNPATEDLPPTFAFPSGTTPPQSPDQAVSKRVFARIATTRDDLEGALDLLVTAALVDESDQQLLFDTLVNRLDSLDAALPNSRAWIGERALRKLLD